MSPDTPPCPICGAPSSAHTRPFCGPACRDRDLLQWLGEGYRMPGAPAGEDEKSGDYGVDRDEE